MLKIPQRTKMNHIFYQTKTKFTNTGDALINNGLINTLRKYGKLHANCSKDVPGEFLSALGIMDEERINYESEFAFIKSVIKCARKSKKNNDRVYVFSGPGDMYGGGIKLVVRNFISGLIFPVFRLYGVTIVRIGRSVGPISKLMALSERIRSIFLSYYYVRDSKSLERCRKHGIKKVKFCPDMSWVYHRDHEKKINHTNTVMLNMRNSIFDDLDDTFVEQTLKSCEYVLCKLNSCMQNQMKLCVAYQIDEDKEFSEKIYNYFKDKYPTEYIGNQMKLDELENYYGGVDFHISNRMHSLLVGYKYGSLPIALIDTKTHTKISATFIDCNLFELMIDIYDSDTENKVDFLFNNREDLIQRLISCEKDNQTKIDETLDFIFNS
ncbi:MAG: polysaccharide pyruvyl transferase family protein [Ruminococcaceae bacterium]|nr:polysaccharide pyruvyl transferase family protein [Oscillospiraceae bacterium]